MPSRALLVLLAAATSLFFVDLGRSSIWDANEAFYVETPREMMERGDYLFPTFNYEPRLNKPVLSYWMVAGLYNVFGVSVGVQRFGIAIGGVLMIAAAMCLGWLASADGRPGLRPAKAGLYGGGALLAGIGLALDPRFVMFSRRIFIDIWISVFMAMTLTFFALSERFPERRRLLLILMYVSVGLGVLTKGPIAAVLPALVFAIYLIAYRELGRAKQMMIPLGVLIVLAIVVPWYVALYQRDGWTYILSFFIGENVGRYTSGIGFQSPRGLAFYLPVVLADAFPLSLFLIAAGVLWWRGRTRIQTLLWLWILVIAAFFSFSHDKQDLYILPVVPAVAALGAAAIVRRDQIPRIVWATTLLLALLLAVAGTGVLYAFQSTGQAYGLEGARLLGAVAAVGGIASALLVVAWRVMTGLVAALITLLAANWLLVARILPGVEPHKPVPALTAYLRPRLGPQDVLATYNVALPSMVYYLQRHVNVYYSPEPFVNDASATRRMFGVLSENDYAALQDQIGAKTCVVHRVPAFEVKLKQVLGRAPLPNLVLITNQCEGR